MSAVNKDEIRKPAVANAFYPGEAQILDHEIEELFNQVKPVELQGSIKALVSPHAGIMYSGPVAATGYKCLLTGDFPVVAIIAPSHREYFPGVSVFNGKGYQTPLGVVPVASDLADLLIAQNQRIVSSWAGHKTEHALEVQLPFLQKVLGAFKLIPIVMGDQNYETCALLGEALSVVLEEVPALVVASSDLSHYHNYFEAVQIDNKTVNLVESFEEHKLADAIETGICEACGGGPIVTAMIAGKNIGADTAKVLLYRNSGDVTGDYTAVVGYLSAAFSQLN
ncbi:MAG: AmmeMemoRadiSam system protein B [bacterium]